MPSPRWRIHADERKTGSNHCDRVSFRAIRDSGGGKRSGHLEQQTGIACPNQCRLACCRVDDSVVPAVPRRCRQDLRCEYGLAVNSSASASAQFRLGIVVEIREQRSLPARVHSKSARFKKPWLARDGEELPHSALPTTFATRIDEPTGNSPSPVVRVNS